MLHLEIHDSRYVLILRYMLHLEGKCVHFNELIYRIKNLEEVCGTFSDVSTGGDEPPKRAQSVGVMNPPNELKVWG